MDIADKLTEKFGIDYWFTKHELPGITEHSTEALVDKGYLIRLDFEHTGIRYYRKVKDLEPELKKK